MKAETIRKLNDIFERSPDVTDEEFSNWLKFKYQIISNTRKEIAEARGLTK